MRSTGLTEMLSRNVGEGEAVGHAHNAYLNLVLEAGVAGLVVVMLFYATLVVLAARLFRQQDPMYVAVGGVALAILTGHLAACIGSQNFWPAEGDIGIWCMIGLLLRMVKVESEVLNLRRMQQQAIRTWRCQPALGRMVTNG
jgi:O-antigen ligase